ncbi:ATP-binding protein [Pseudomonadota bacterium]
MDENNPQTDGAQGTPNTEPAPAAPPTGTPLQSTSPMRQADTAPTAPVAPVASNPALPAAPSAPVAPAPAPEAPVVPAPIAETAPVEAPAKAPVDLESKPVRIAITLPTNAYFLSGIRDFTLGLIRNMTEFSEQWAFRFQSVVDELCNNAIEHGSAPGEDITIKFISIPQESIEIVVQDSGTGKVKLSAKELKGILDQRTQPNYVHVGIRGRGLSKIVFEWTDELEFQDLESGGVEVRIKKFLKDPKLKEIDNSLENPTHLVIQ